MDVSDSDPSSLPHALRRFWSRLADPQRLWRSAWWLARRAKSDADVQWLAGSSMGRRALEALRQREIALEEDERNEPHPCLVGLVEQSKTGLAIRALRRRGWTDDQVKTATLDLVNAAARLIRARAPLAGEQHKYRFGLGSPAVATVQRCTLVHLNGMLVPAVFFMRDGVFDACTLNVWRQRTRVLAECNPAIVCEAGRVDGIACPPDSCDREDGLR